MNCAVCGEQLAQPERGRRRRYCSRSCQARAYRARRAAPTPPHRPRPHRLTSVGIAHAAVDLADRNGIDGLTMRRLAGELGVATTALYRHFTDREHLLAAMTELVLAESLPPPAGLADWRTRLRHEATQEWQLYRRHPWLLPVLARTRPPLGPALLDLVERSFAALDTLGMSRADILSAYLACSGLVQGLALLRNAERPGADLGTGPAVGTRQPPSELDELVDPALRPALYKVFSAPDELQLDFDTLLDHALDLLLDGVAVRYRSATA